jgi:hypothetical protein
MHLLCIVATLALILTTTSITTNAEMLHIRSRTSGLLSRVLSSEMGISLERSTYLINTGAVYWCSKIDSSAAIKVKHVERVIGPADSWFVNEDDYLRIFPEPKRYALLPPKQFAKR